MIDCGKERLCRFGCNAGYVKQYPAFWVSRGNELCCCDRLSVVTEGQTGYKQDSE
jgi:hypothetical protein